MRVRSTILASVLACMACRPEVPGDGPTPDEPRLTAATSVTPRRPTVSSIAPAPRVVVKPGSFGTGPRMISMRPTPSVRLDDIRPGRVVQVPLFREEPRAHRFVAHACTDDVTVSDDLATYAWDVGFQLTEENLVQSLPRSPVDHCAMVTLRVNRVESFGERIFATIVVPTVRAAP